MGEVNLFESLFRMPSAIRRHQIAPLRDERQSFLRSLLGQGKRRKAVRETAALLLHVIRLLGINKSSRITAFEIREAGSFWARELLSHRKSFCRKSAPLFVTAAYGFCRFHGLMRKSDSLPFRFDFAFSAFHRSLVKSGYLPTTIKALASPTKAFLLWAQKRHDNLSLISCQDIDAYLNERRSAGSRARTILAHCQALRSFFRFAEGQGWTQVGLAGTISTPIVQQDHFEVIGPPWKDVRRMIRMTGTRSAADCRARVVLILCAIYGLRTSEVRGLTLEAFDWRAETFTVRRAKNGWWQRFPIQPEFAQAVIDYLRIGRPRCICRNLLVTLSTPFRPLQNLGPIVKKQMRNAGLNPHGVGPHSLRHACATELLRRGTSLQRIAGLLGHRDLRSVNIYAKFDLRSLQAVSDFSLSGIL